MVPDITTVELLCEGKYITFFTPCQYHLSTIFTINIPCQLIKVFNVLSDARAARGVIHFSPAKLIDLIHDAPRGFVAYGVFTFDTLNKFLDSANFFNG
jgi:hypothetical protein